MPTQGDETIEAFSHYYDRPYEIPKKESFLQFIYNSERKTVLNRSGSSWGKWCLINAISKIIFIFELSFSDIFFK